METSKELQEQHIRAQKQNNGNYDSQYQKFCPVNITNVHSSADGNIEMHVQSNLEITMKFLYITKK